MIRKFKALKGILRSWIQEDRSVEISNAFENCKLWLLFASINVI